MSSVKERTVKAFIGLALTLAIFFCTIPYGVFEVREVEAAGEQYGYINVSDAVSLRDSALTSYVRDSKGNIAKVYPNEKVLLLGSSNTSSGKVYKIQCKFNNETIVGFLKEEYIQIYDGTYDEGYAASLRQAGFPESYIPALCYLHKLKPNWVFKPQFTGTGTSLDTSLDWNQVLKEEQTGARNLVQKSSSTPSSWMSYESPYYNWSTDTHVVYDSGNFVRASNELIAFYLDPRNMLNEKLMFGFWDISYDASVQTQAGVQEIVKNSFMKGALTDDPNKTYAQTFMEVAAATGSNPYVLAATVLAEQGTNNSGNLPGNISGKYPGHEGYYNYFNIGAWAHSGRGAQENGVIFAATTPASNNTYQRPWNTVAKSIMGGGLYLYNQYIKNGQKSLYLEKYDVVGPAGSLYNNQYCTAVLWVGQQAMTMRSTCGGMTSTLTFNIPVYKNMPDTPYEMPDGIGSVNNVLKELNLTVGSTKYDLTPRFDPWVSEYSLVVPQNVSSVAVSAAVANPSAKVTGNGNVALKMGSNEVVVSVSAGSGAVRSYKINIYRQGVVAEDISSTNYIIDNGYILAAAPGTNASTILGAIKVAGGTKYIVKPDGQTKVADGEKVGTGYQLITDKNRYTIVVNGDPSGDGDVGIKDLLMARRQLLGIAKLSEVEALAASVSGASEIGIKDLLVMRRHLLGIAYISSR